MIKNKLFFSTDSADEIRAGSGFRVIDSTATIDLQNLLTTDLTKSGSFDVRGSIWATTFGRLLQSLPIPCLLVDEDSKIVAANEACSRFTSNSKNIVDSDFSDFFSETPPHAVPAPLTALQKILETRIPQVCEGVLEFSEHKIWARLSFRSIRIVKQRHILVLIEDLTAEKRQLKIQRKYAKKLENEISKREMAEERRDESEKLYQRVVELANDIIWQADNTGKVTMINPVGLEKTGYTRQEIIGRNILDFVDVEHRNDVEQEFKKQKENLITTQIYEVPIKTKSGAIIWLSQNIQLLMQGDTITGVQSIARDVTDRKKAEQALKDAHDNLEQMVEERTRELAKSYEDLKKEVLERKSAQESLTLANRIIEETSEGIIITDTDGQVTYVNEAFCSQSGYSRDELMGNNPRILKSDKHGPRFFKQMWDTIIEKGHWHGEVWDKKKDGTDFPKLLSISAITNKSGDVTHYVGFSTDISDIKRTEARLKQMAHYDPLTGLANRTLFRDRLIQALVQAKRANKNVALILLDLDRFKDINDMMGHPVGDALLEKVSERLRACVRESDTVGRLGGDEFTVLAPNLHDTKEVNRIADRILESISEPCIISGREIFVSTSMGIALFPDDGAGPDRLLQNADTALYRAKERGRNNYQFFSEEMNEELMVRSQLESALREALEKDQLELHYQPVVDFTTGRISAAEALLRWNHSSLGWVSPQKIVRLAEDTGLIIPLGEWILRSACQASTEWKKQGLNGFSVAINISGLQLNRSNFLKSVQEIIDQTKVDPSAISFELTETVAMRDIGTTSNIFQQLRDMGLKIIVDDFGTGYSSLSYLRALPIDVLKIDRAFVEDIAHSPSNRAIVSAIVAMGHSLDLKVVAEGIETNEQLCHLWALDCDEWQGHLFSKALRPRDFELYLEGDCSASVPGVNWTHDLSVNVPKIDDQHRVWCERVNTLYKSVWNGVKTSELREFIGFISDYARLHFTDEEALMIQFKYPQYEEHRLAHRDLMSRVQDLKDRLSGSKVDAELVSDLLNELHNWFVDHIKHIDKELGNFLKSKMV